MISLERTKTVSIPFLDVNVDVTFNVPTAEEAQTKIRGVKELTDTGLFKDTVLNSPGTFNLVSKVAMEIVNAAFLMESEKN